MTFSLHGGEFMSSHIAHTQLSDIDPLAHILNTCAWLFSRCGLYPNRIIHQNDRGRDERTQGQARMAA